MSSLFYTQKPSFPALISTVHTISSLNISYSISVLISELLLWFSENCEGEGSKRKGETGLSYSAFHIQRSSICKRAFSICFHMWAPTASKPWLTHIFIMYIQLMTLKNHIASAVWCLHCSDCARYIIKIFFQITVKAAKLKERPNLLTITYEVLRGGKRERMEYREEG